MHGKQVIQIPPSTKRGESIYIRYTRPELTQDIFQKWPESLKDAKYAYRQKRDDVKTSCAAQQYVHEIEAPGWNWIVKSVVFLAPNPEGTAFIAVDPKNRTKPSLMVIEWEQVQPKDDEPLEWSF